MNQYLSELLEKHSGDYMATIRELYQKSRAAEAQFEQGELSADNMAALASHEGASDAYQCVLMLLGEDVSAIPVPARRHSAGTKAGRSRGAQWCDDARLFHETGD